MNLKEFYNYSNVIPNLIWNPCQKVSSLSQRYQNKSGMTKIGAMFGLDARIALAIFGALSVISGAALYSAIQQSKVTQMVTTANEVLKAVEQYMLDTGSNLTIDPDNPATFNPGDLLTSSIDGWKGPYLPIDTSNIVTVGPDYIWGNPLPNVANFQILQKGLDTWGAGVTGSCDSSNPCRYTVKFTASGSYDTGFVKAVDEYVDGTSDLDNGKVRFRNSSIYILGHIVM